jgi:hypothetical protein
MSTGGPDVLERHEQALTAFVLRARRVRAHSLARDLAALQKLQHPQYTITGRTDSEMVTLRTEYPPEEQVESAAARIRPLLLERDSTYFAKAINGLLYFAREGGAERVAIDGLKALRKEWVETASERSARLTYEVRIKQGEAPEESMNDRRLAFAWIYGDVVHADTARRDGADVFGVEERFHGAVPLVAQLMVLTITTLRKIEWLHGAKLLPFLHDAFAEDVVVTRQVVEREAKAWVGGYGDGDVPPAFPADADEEPGEGWSRFGDEFGPAPANGTPNS